MGKEKGFTAVSVKAAPPGRHADKDCKGLYLEVDASGARRWFFRYQLGGQRKQMGLGGAGKDGLSLADARRLAGEARQAVLAGADPLEARRKAEAEAALARKPKTFREAADEFIAAMEGGWKSEKHRGQWRMTLTSYCAPIRDMDVAEIDTAHVLAVLTPLWQSRPETARRLRGRIENVLDACAVRGERSPLNPARWRGHLDKLLPRKPKLVHGHHKALAYAEMPAFVATLRARPAVAARALEFLALTATRTNEALRATWGEIDMGARVWTIPASRMKSNRPHRVPLSDRAVAILNEMGPIRAHDGPDCPLFPSPRDGRKPLSQMALLVLLRRMGRDADTTPHGMRSSFRDWASEATGFPHEVCEMALAHVIANKAEAAYRRGDLLERRRELMSAWAAFCEPSEAGSNVVTLRGAGA